MPRNGLFGKFRLLMLGKGVILQNSFKCLEDILLTLFLRIPLISSLNMIVL